MGAKMLKFVLFVERLVRPRRHRLAVSGQTSYHAVVVRPLGCQVVVHSRGWREN